MLKEKTHSDIEGVRCHRSWKIITRGVNTQAIIGSCPLIKRLQIIFHNYLLCFRCVLLSFSGWDHEYLFEICAEHKMHLQGVSTVYINKACVSVVNDHYSIPINSDQLEFLLLIIVQRCHHVYHRDVKPGTATNIVGKLFTLSRALQSLPQWVNLII